MMLKRSFVILSLVWLMAPSARVSAEWFGDLYVGPAFTKSRDLKVDYTALGLPKYTIKDVNFDTSALFGGRVGHWFEAIPYVGVAIDASHFSPDVSSQSATECPNDGAFCTPGRIKLNISVTAVSFNAMWRWPLLQTKEIPNGRLQPYALVGPTIFIARRGHLSDNPLQAESNQSDTRTTLGVQAGGGLAWQFHPNIAVFGEYRFTHFRSPTFSLRDNLIPSSQDEVADISLNTHSALFGVSFRFR